MTMMSDCILKMMSIRMTVLMIESGECKYPPIKVNLTFFTCSYGLQPEMK